MHRTPAAVALTLMLVAGASAQDTTTPEQRRAGAAMIEWAVANCDMSKIPAMHVAVASMVIQGSTPDQMNIFRNIVRRGAEKRPLADACSSVLAEINKPIVQEN